MDKRLQARLIVFLGQLDRGEVALESLDAAGPGLFRLRAEGGWEVVVRADLRTGWEGIEQVVFPGQVRATREYLREEMPEAARFRPQGKLTLTAGQHV